MPRCTMRWKNFFKIERIDIPETEEEAAWLASQNFTNTADEAYTG